MIPKRYRYTHKFEVGLKKLKRKHGNDILQNIDSFFEKALQAYPNIHAKKMTEMFGRPIYKVRVGIARNVGKRGGLRIIFGFKEDMMVGLFVYGKSDKATLSSREMKDIIRDFDEI